MSTTDPATLALQQACWHCSSFAGLTADGGSARCMHRGALHIKTPLGGCCYFSRVPGSDDCLTPPAGFNAGGLSDVWREMVAKVLADESPA